MQYSQIIQTQGKSYPFHIKEGIFSQVAEKISSLNFGEKCAIITDSIVKKYYGDSLRDQMENAGFKVDLLEIPAGEASKSLSSIEFLSEELIKRGHNRNSFLLSLGGGVVGDITGFLSSVFLRGIKYLQIPTTIISQVDSSIGGKTGVNLKSGKNLIGTFYHPEIIFIDPSLLSTLPERRKREGFSEIIKHACIANIKLFEHLERKRFDIPDSYLINQNILIKKEIVETDEKETLGKRELLNFGHSLGHSIETASKYQKIFHGEAVAIGIHAALHLSKIKNKFPDESINRVLEILKYYQLPVSLPEDFCNEKILQIMQKDKKFTKGIRYVLLKEIGKAEICEKVTPEEIAEVLNIIKEK